MILYFLLPMIEMLMGEKNICTQRLTNNNLLLIVVNTLNNYYFFTTDFEHVLLVACRTA